MYSTGIAYLLWFLSGFGALGLHRFYLGKIPTGILWMMTGGLCMIGSIYDFFTLQKQVREANIRNALYNQLLNKPLNVGCVNDGEAMVVKDVPKESLERIILKLAKENKGILTTTEVALAADITIDEARKTLENLVSKGYAELRVRKSGGLVYIMPDIKDKDEPLEDF
jgi:TM2 domain-containing membrane protein YozV